MNYDKFPIENKDKLYKFKIYKLNTNLIDFSNYYNLIKINLRGITIRADDNIILEGLRNLRTLIVDFDILNLHLPVTITNLECHRINENILNKLVNLQHLYMTYHNDYVGSLDYLNRLETLKQILTTPLNTVKYENYEKEFDSSYCVHAGYNIL